MIGSMGCLIKVDLNRSAQGVDKVCQHPFLLNNYCPAHFFVIMNIFIQKDQGS